MLSVLAFLFLFLLNYCCSASLKRVYSIGNIGNNESNKGNKSGHLSSTDSLVYSDDDDGGGTVGDGRTGANKMMDRKLLKVDPHSSDTKIGQSQAIPITASNSEEEDYLNVDVDVDVDVDVVESPVFKTLKEQRQHPYFQRKKIIPRSTSVIKPIALLRYENPIISQNSIVYDALISCQKLDSPCSKWFKIKSASIHDRKIEVRKEVRLLMSLKKEEQEDGKSFLPTIVGNDLFSSYSLPGLFFVMQNILHDPSAHVHLSEENIVWYGCQLLDAIDWTHSKGIIHCDLKPANILIDTSSEHLYLIDWGNSVLWDKEDPPSNVLSTSWWRAPEMELEVLWDYWVDMWSIGVILLNWLLKETTTFSRRRTFYSDSLGLGEQKVVFECCSAMLDILGSEGFVNLAIEKRSPFGNVVKNNPISIAGSGWNPLLCKALLLRSSSFSEKIIAIIAKIIIYSPHLRLTACSALQEITGVFKGADVDDDGGGGK